MESAPDISKVINIILENPKIIESLKSMMSDGSEPKVGEAAEIAEIRPETLSAERGESGESDTAVMAKAAREGKRHRRHALLSALKPYVSEKRAAAIDTMMNIGDIIDAVRWS